MLASLGGITDWDSREGATHLENWKQYSNKQTLELSDQLRSYQYLSPTLSLSLSLYLILSLHRKMSLLSYDWLPRPHSQISIVLGVAFVLFCCAVCCVCVIVATIAGPPEPEKQNGFLRLGMMRGWSRVGESGEQGRAQGQSK